LADGFEVVDAWTGFGTFFLLLLLSIPLLPGIIRFFSLPLPLQLAQICLSKSASVEHQVQRLLIPAFGVLDHALVPESGDDNEKPINKAFFKSSLTLPGPPSLGR
jgi:hypothetical protein